MARAIHAGASPNTEETILRLIERYERSGRAVSVNFRGLVDWIPVGERATHYIHPYPAKLLPQIPAFFLANSILSQPGSTVLDPFCGSGTVLLESILHNRTGLGADANPLARLIASAKVTNYDLNVLRRESTLLLRRARRYRSATPPDVVNIRHWFYPHVIEQLSRLRRAVDAVDETSGADFFRVCLSACVRRVSLADPRLSVPVRLREDQYPDGHPFREPTNARLRRLRRQDVSAEFEAIVAANIERVDALNRIRGDRVSAAVVATDARHLTTQYANGAKLKDGSIDFILTSPPYAGAQKYIRSSSLSIGWLGLNDQRTLRQLEDQNIGREHFATGGHYRIPQTGIAEADRRVSTVAARNPLRALISATYLIEMRQALAEACRVLRPGGHMVLVASNNRVCGREFMTQRYLQHMLEDQGMVVRLRVVDAIKSRGLMTRRNSTASVITREWALLFQKPAMGAKP